MNRTQWRRVRAVFEHCLELAPDERTSHLAQQLADDDEARAEVERLLAAEPLARDYLTPPGDATLAPLSPTAQLGPRPGERIGAYELITVLGQGGMGTVYEAHQELPNRTVALKVMRQGLGSERARRRVLDEIEALARLQHPGIAQVFDAGTDGGQPWFAMELLQAAQPITGFAAQHHLELRPRLELLLQVADAVQHAHQRGVIHRDLKPANILVDDGGRAKVIDFGIARTLAHDLSRLTAAGTQAGELLGTLLYMSPEQLAGAGDTDVRSDVYGLGVVCYELLAGRRPFALEGLSLPDACRVIAEQDPPPLHRAAPHLPPELDWVVQRALRKEREARYGTVAEFATDLRRFLLHEPVAAAPPGAGYRLRKFLRRHRTMAGAAAVALLTTAGAFVAVSLSLVRARSAEVAERLRGAEATASAARAEAAVDFLLDVFATAAPEKSDKGKDLTMAEGLELAGRDFDKRFQQQPDIRVSLARTMGMAWFELGEYDKADHSLQQALTTAEQHLGHEGLEVARVLVDLTHVRLQEGATTAAALLLERTDAILQRHPDADTATRAKVIRADLLRVTGKKPDAAALLRSAVVDLTARHGEGDRRTLLAINSLATVLHELGDIDAAEPLYRQALAGLTNLKGERDPDALSAMNNLAMVLFARRASPGSLAALQHVFEVRSRLLGPDHPDTLKVLANISGQHYVLGEFEQARHGWQEMLDRLPPGMPRTHPFVQSLLANIGTVERDLGNYPRAAELLKEVLGYRKQSPGESDVNTLTIWLQLAETYREQGDLDAAATEFVACLHIVEAKTPPDLANLYRCNLGIGRIAAQRHQFVAAEKALLACRDGYTEALAHVPQKSLLLRVEPELAQLYEQWGKPEEAQRYRDIVAAKDFRLRAGVDK